jgi:hypothetical protein
MASFDLNDYVQVNERIEKFYEKYPEGSIQTEIILNENGMVIFKAYAYRNNEDTRPATGHAMEKEGSSYINKTSHIENCETSAVGRALGMCGFGIDTSVASAEEVENAILNQGKDEIHVCENCGSEITDGRKNDGSVWSAKDIAAYTARKFGKELCTECAKKESNK